MQVALNLLASIAEILESAVGRSRYRWRRLLSIIVAARCGVSGSHVFLGRGTSLTGHRHIFLRGRFVALERNRISAISEHQGHKFEPSLEFGDEVSMEHDCHIGCINKVQIGNRVLIASRVFISDHSHGDTTFADLLQAPNNRRLSSKGPVIIEEDVWLGEGVAVMPGVRIGRSSIIGANAVVTRDIPAYSVAVGAPARVIKRLRPPEDLQICPSASQAAVDDARRPFASES